VCYCCTVVVRQLQLPLVPVVAITPYRLGDAMHHLLRGYKDAPLADERLARTHRLAGILEGWLDLHAPDLRHRLRGGWDTVATVPSSRCPPRDSAGVLVAAVPALARLHRVGLVGGPEPTDHLVASAQGFTVRSQGPVGHQLRVLVVDDSYTTGARAQSAAAALRLAGIDVAAVLVVGRVVAPEATPWQAAYWAATRAERVSVRSAPRRHAPGVRHQCQ
jgi:hypothetical protein